MIDEHQTGASMSEQIHLCHWRLSLFGFQQTFSRQLHFLIDLCIGLILCQPVDMLHFT